MNPLVENSSGGFRPKSPLVCPHCLAEGRGQRTEYDLRANLYVCLVHGPTLTEEWIDDALPTRGRR